MAKSAEEAASRQDGDYITANHDQIMDQYNRTLHDITQAIPDVKEGEQA